MSNVVYLEDYIDNGNHEVELDFNCRPVYVKNYYDMTKRLVISEMDLLAGGVGFIKHMFPDAEVEIEY